MELKDFVKSTLLQIVDATAEAQEELRARPDNTAAINPRPQFLPQDTKRAVGSAIEDISFDVAITAAEGKEVKGGVGVVVASVIGLGTQAQRSLENTEVSRICFSVPITLPRWPQEPGAAQLRQLDDLASGGWRGSAAPQGRLDPTGRASVP